MWCVKSHSVCACVCESVKVLDITSPCVKNIHHLSVYIFRFTGTHLRISKHEAFSSHPPTLPPSHPPILGTYGCDGCLWEPKWR